MGAAGLPRFSTVLEHYGFWTDPFGDSPDPGLFYRATGHVKVLESLIDGEEKGIFLQAITSEPGVGKTTILELLLDRLHDSEVVLHRQPKLTCRESLKYLLGTLGIPPDAEDIEGFRRQLIEAAERKRKTGRPLILVIDDAHNLRDETLAILDSLGPTQSDKSPSLKLILAALKGSSPALEGLCRSNDRCRPHQLPPLSPDEIGPYIAHRLNSAGYKGPEIFTPFSVLMIAEHSGRVPREINMVCSEALRVCMESTAMTVDEHCVQQTIARLRDSYKSEAPRDFLVSGAIPLRVEERRFPNAAIVIEEVERWSLRHEHSWSGTIGELFSELQSEADTSFRSDGGCPTEFLLSTLEENAPTLAAHGLALSISATEGCLRVITIRRTNPRSKSEVENAGSVDGTNPGEDGLVESVTLPHQEPLQSSSPAQPKPASEPAAITTPVSEPTHESESDTEIFRHVLLDSERVAGERGRFPRPPKLLILAVILAALALFWARRTFVDQAKGDRPLGKVRTAGPVTGSDDPHSTLLGLLRSAETGDPASQLALANMYQSGEVVQKDDAKAVHWLQEAASQGETEAAYRLGDAYKTGQGIPANTVQAYCWYVIAAEAGHGASEQQIKELTPQLSDADIAAVRYRLGEMHLRGEGTKADPGAAYFWFHLAQVAGHPAARQAKQMLLSQMNDAQIAEASEKAAKWLQTHPPRSATNTSQSPEVATPR